MFLWVGLAVVGATTAVAFAVAVAASKQFEHCLLMNGRAEERVNAKEFAPYSSFLLCVRATHNPKKTSNIHKACVWVSASFAVLCL